MGSPRHPLVILPAGPVGRQAVDRLTAALDADRAVWRVLDGEGDLSAPLHQALGELLRIARDEAPTAEPRLDLVALLDLTEPLADGHPDPRALTEAVSRVIGEGFGRVFPPDLPPEQRSVGLHLVVAVPPLTRTRAAGAALKAIMAVERWAAEQATHPTLARVWLAPTQTRAGVLTADDVASSMAGFTLAMFGTGQRDVQAVRDRLSHPRPGVGRIGMIAVGTLDVPLARVRDLARRMAAHEALEVLVRRVQRGPVDERRVREGVGSLSPKAWLDPFTDGEPAQALRNLAYRRAGGRELPETLAVGPTDTTESLHERFAALLEPPQGPRSSSADDDADLAAARRSLHGAEARIRQDLARALDALLDDRLVRTRPLDRMPEIEAGLERIRDRLVHAQAEDGADEPRVDHAALQASLDAAQAAVAALPDRAQRRAVGLGAGLGAGALAVPLAWTFAAPAPTAGAAATLSATQVSTTAPPPPAPGFDATVLAPWGLALAVALLTAVLVAVLVGTPARRRAEEALKARQEALQGQRSADAAGRASREAAALLRTHRQRVRRAAIRHLDHLLAQLEAVRGLMIAQRDALAQQLGALGLSGRQGPADPPWFGPQTRLHAGLVSPEAVTEWVQRAQRFSDPEAWADRVLDRTWPARGLAHDAPASDRDPLLAAAEEQLQGLEDRGLLDDEATAAEAAESVARFGRRAAHALLPGVTPTDEAGDRALGVRPGELLVVAPQRVRRTFEEALRRAEVGVAHALWTPDPAPRVLLVRTWEGHTTAELARGAGFVRRDGSEA